MSDVRSKVVLGIDVNEFRRGITQVDSSIKGISKQFQNLGGIIGASFAVSKIQEFVSASLDLALKAQGIEVAFERIGNSANMDNLRTAVQGTVSDLELMRQAVTAQKLGIPIQEFTKYLSYAKKQANEMGESVDYMVDSIVKGVGRQSTMILDNLGISAKAVQSELKKGGTFAEAVGRIIQQEMGAANGTLLTTQDRLLQQQAALENIKKELGEKLLPVYEAALGWLNNALYNINLLFGEQLSLIEKVRYFASYLDASTGALIRMQIESEEAARATNGIVIQAAMVGVGFDNSADSLKKLGSELQKIAGIKVQGGLKLSDVEKGLAPKETALTPLYQTNMAVFGIRRQTEYAAGSWEHYTESIVNAARASNDWLTASQKNEEQLAAMVGVGQEFGNILKASFEASIINGESFFETFKKGFKSYIQQMLAMAAATTALAIAIAFVTGGANFQAAFNKIGGGMGLPFGFNDDNKLSLKLSGTDFYGGFKRNETRVSRSGG